MVPAPRKATPWWREELSLKTKADVERKIRHIVSQYPDNTPLRDPDAAFCIKVLQHHHQYALKAGNGIAHMEVRTNQLRTGATRGFWLVRADGSAVDISWVVALQPEGRPTPKSDVMSAARYEVAPQISSARTEIACCVCPLCGADMDRDADLHVDHVIHFDDLLAAWLTKNSLLYATIAVEDTGIGGRFADRSLAANWRKWHQENAVLRLTHASCNLSRKKGIANGR